MAEPLLSDRMKMLLVMGSLLAFNVMCGFGIQRLSSQREMIKEDYSQVNSIRYGLLSVDAWKERIRAVVAGRIGDFSLSKAQEGVLLGEISRVLDALIVEADKALQKRQRGLSGKMRKIAIRAFVSVQDLRRRVPEFSQAVVDELQTPGHTKKLKALAQSGFDGYAAQSFDRAEDTAHLRGLLQRHQAGDVPAFNRAAEQRLRELESDIRAYCVVMLDSALAFLFAWWLLRRKQELHRPLFSMSAAFALVLLVVGLALPMIDLDARIKSVDFLFWGERIEFHDQVLFFRSKSILQVVKVLMDTGKADSILVGALLVLFSVLFPAAKLAAMELLMRGGGEAPGEQAPGLLRVSVGEVVHGRRHGGRDLHRLYRLQGDIEHPARRAQRQGRVRGGHRHQRHGAPAGVHPLHGVRPLRLRALGDREEGWSHAGQGNVTPPP